MKIGPMGCTETSVTTNLRCVNTQEDRKSYYRSLYGLNSHEQNITTFKKSKMWCSVYETFKFLRYFIKGNKSVNERRGEEYSKKI
jgi:hypothetical protein